MIQLLFLMPVLCGFFGFGCEEPEQETIYTIQDGNFTYSIIINSTDTSKWIEKNSTLTTSGVKWSLEILDKDFRYIDERLNVLADACESVNGTFIFEPKIQNNFCKLDD